MILNEETKKRISEEFEKNLNQKVIINYFCNSKTENCEILEQLLNELKETSEKIEIKKLKEEELNELNISLNPVLFFENEKRKFYNVRYYGLPAGYEFQVIIEDIIDISKNEAKVAPKTLEIIKKLKNVKAKIFVTPTCPYCPMPARTLHKFAILNESFHAYIYEVTEFPELAEKYDVYAVPKIIINNKYEIIGALSELKLAEEIYKLVNQ